MNGPYKLKYKNSAFPFKTGIPEDDIKSRFYKHMTTPSKETQQFKSSKSTKKTVRPIISGRATITKEGSHGGGFVGGFISTEFGGIIAGVSGGGSTSKKYDYPSEGYKFTPTIGVSYNVPSGKRHKKQQKQIETYRKLGIK